MNGLNQWINDRASSLQADASWQGQVSFVQPEHDGGGFVINIDTERIIAQFVVWSTWAFEASALSVESGEPFYFDSKVQANELMLTEGWTRFMAAITEVEVG